MRFFDTILIPVAAICLLVAPSTQAEDGSPFRFLFGTKQDGANKAKSSVPSKGGKRVEIDLTSQTLRAYDGIRLVMKTNISSGRNRATPTGRFRAGYKDADHYSSLFNNAPMPWSVQVSGNIFIHGFSVVPDYPASHGCIRVPITGRNPAKRFFNWVDVGTPITIAY